MRFFSSSHYLHTSPLLCRYSLYVVSGLEDTKAAYGFSSIIDVFPRSVLDASHSLHAARHIKNDFDDFSDQVDQQVCKMQIKTENTSWLSVILQ
jgi:hypothetical protein